ncbi:MAG TPA: twin-arginine translocase subunit TatC [Verrucomicrobiae bacterium]|nr:twin-arginine translocase subunit TatC [Verrucomicrobiae bacterium]
MKTKKKSTHNRRTAPHSRRDSQKTQPFIEHAYELRRRLYYIAVFVVAWGSATYAVQQHVVNILLKPAHGQHFIYTSPGGGIDFLFRICVYSGLVLSTPVIVYNILEFFEPLMSRASRRFIAINSMVCGLLALAGVAFGYFIGLPAALNFLFHQFTTAQIKPLVTIQSYLGFVIAYLLGSALLFQLPLILVCINRIKPLKPQRLFRYERWVILAAFVLAGLMNPTLNLLSQLLVAGPFILMYQIGIALIAFINRPRRQRAAEPRLQRSVPVQAAPDPRLARSMPAASAAVAAAQIQAITRPPASTIVMIADIHPRQASPSTPRSFMPRERLVARTAPPAPRPSARYASLHRNEQRFMDFIQPSSKLFAPE